MRHYWGDGKKKDWRQRNRQRHNRHVRGIYRIRKVKFSNKLKDERGGKCCMCGWDKNYAGLIWHHVSEDTKVMDISKVSKINSASAEEKIRIEVSKCILVCANCHSMIHYPQLNRG